MGNGVARLENGARLPDRAPPDPLRTCFWPLGIELVVETDRPEFLAAVASAWRGCEGEPDPTAPCLRLQMTTSTRLQGTEAPDIGVEDQRLRLSSAGVDGWADAATRTARCTLSDDYALDERLRDEVLDPLILFLLVRNGRVPIHAAGFLIGDLAILLAGPSGSGKSCLALAAQRAGYQLLSDDMVFVQQRPDLRIWGLPRPIHVFPEDARADGSAVRIRNGKLKHAIALEASTRAMPAERAVLCMLERGQRVSLERIGKHEAVEAHRVLEPGFDLLGDEIRAAIAAIAQDGAWRLTLSADPDEAIRALAGSYERLLVAGAPASD